jgi:hypothetical protein
MQHGQGEYFFADLQKTYVGEFSEGQIEGLGSETWESGKAYEGFFSGGKKNGEGLMFYPRTARAYLGQWL